MKFCPVVPEICRGQVHGAQKERIIIIIIIRNGAKTISLQMLFGRLNYHQTCVVCSSKGILKNRVIRKIVVLCRILFVLFLLAIVLSFFKYTASDYLF